jgi:hypothetical protein
MRLVLEVGSSQWDLWLAGKRRTTDRVLLQVLWKLTRKPADTLETTIARAIDQAFSEFSREMAG